jgi:hypothetical protein
LDCADGVGPEDDPEPLKVTAAPISVINHQSYPGPLRASGLRDAFRVSLGKATLDIESTAVLGQLTRR